MVGEWVIAPIHLGEGYFLTAESSPTIAGSGFVFIRHPQGHIVLGSSYESEKECMELVLKYSLEHARVAVTDQLKGRD